MKPKQRERAAVGQPAFHHLAQREHRSALPGKEFSHEPFSCRDQPGKRTHRARCLSVQVVAGAKDGCKRSNWSPLSSIRGLFSVKTPLALKNKQTNRTMRVAQERQHWDAAAQLTSKAGPWEPEKTETTNKEGTAPMGQ